MPKEVIQYGGCVDRHRTDDDGGLITDHQVPHPNLEVTWDRSDVEEEGRVTVRFTLDEFYHKHYSGEVITSNGLTRKQINHLIKTLRRARNAAFGEDE